MKKAAFALVILMTAAWAAPGQSPKGTVATARPPKGTVATDQPPKGTDATVQPARWVKGNTHAHTRNSDGNEMPRRVVRWYQDYGYQFLFITDHDMVTETAYLDADGSRDDFILIPGQEITRTFEKRPAHVCALNPARPVPSPASGASMVQTLQNSIAAARAAGAVPQINHPNWKWSFGFDEMKELRDVRLFELLNVNRDSNNFSAGGRPGTEELWDALLSNGLVLYGVASDDTHDYLGDFIPDIAYPGKGWVMVRVGELTPAAVCSSLESGDFYATTGVELDDVSVTKSEYRLAIRPLRDTAYTTRFIGRNGVVLKEEHGLTPTYAFKGDELYVRARVFSSAGELAFCQPVFIRK